MKTYRIAAIPGDGIGTEVIRAGIEVLKVAAARNGGFAFDIETFGWGTDYYLEHGRMMPADGLSQLEPFDAIYFGSAGDPRVPGPCLTVGPQAGDLPTIRPGTPMSARHACCLASADHCVTLAKTISTG